MVEGDAVGLAVVVGHHDVEIAIRIAEEGSPAEGAAQQLAAVEQQKTALGRRDGPRPLVLRPPARLMALASLCL
jgi:hypothetical protein